MQKLRVFFIFYLLLVLFIWSCGVHEKPSDINLEQQHNEATQRILAPGMGAIGLISEGSVHIHYFHESGKWQIDESLHFDLPENNQGLLAMGVGTIAVVQDGFLNFFRLNALNTWQHEEYLTFRLPVNYDRLLAMKMPWEVGIIAIETDGILDFYYFYDDEWQHDPTASFSIPRGISSYYLTGDMTIAVVDGQKLGLYYLGPEDGWEFLDHDAFVLLLPEGYKGIVPFEQQMIAVLIDNRLVFYGVDLEDDRWILFEDLHFDLPF